MIPNPSNQCIACLKSQIDFTENLDKVQIVNQCSTCAKYMKNQNSWRKFGFEQKMSQDKDFIRFLIKNIGGIKKFKVVDYEVLGFNHDDKLEIKLILETTVNG